MDFFSHFSCLFHFFIQHVGIIDARKTARETREKRKKIKSASGTTHSLIRPSEYRGIQFGEIQTGKFNEILSLLDISTQSYRKDVFVLFHFISNQSYNYPVNKGHPLRPFNCQACAK